MKAKRPLWVALGLALMSTLLMLAGVIMAKPEYYRALFGVRLRYAAPTKTNANLLVQIVAQEGKAVYGAQESKPAVELEDSSKLDALIEESCLSNDGAREFQVDYKIKEIRSEQMAWNQPQTQGMRDFGWSCILNELGHLNSNHMTSKVPALWARDSTNWMWQTAWWAPLPRQHVKVGDAWSTEVQAHCSLPEKPDGFPVTFRLTEKLVRVSDVQGLQLAEFDIEGPISSSAAEISGTYRAKSMFSLLDQRCLATQFSCELAGSIPLKVGGQEMKIAYRQAVEGTMARGSK